MNLNKPRRTGPVLTVLCCLFLASNVYMWMAKERIQKHDRSVEDHVRKLESDNQTLITSERSLQDQKKDLELKLGDLTKSFTELNSQVESVKAANTQFSDDVKSREAEIMRLNIEIENLNADVLKYKQDSEDVAGNLTRVNAAYEELKRQFHGTASEGERPDNHAQEMTDQPAAEDRPASLGTMVVKA